jgi:hypothetical protein
MTKRLLILLLLVAVLVLGIPSFAGATGACGYVTVQVLTTTPVSAPGLPYCNTCSGGIGQGPNDPWVWPVYTWSYFCTHI